jgi:BMFP domain-containing protein YqiC
VSESTVYGIKISTEILERADKVAEELSKDVRQFPSGQAGRADVVRRAIIIGLDAMESKKK